MNIAGRTPRTFGTSHFIHSPISRDSHVTHPSAISPLKTVGTGRVSLTSPDDPAPAPAPATLVSPTSALIAAILAAN